MGFKFMNGKVVAKLQDYYDFDLSFASNKLSFINLQLL